MPLIVDTMSAVRRLDDWEFRRWSASRTVFLSSEMRELGGLRATVAAALRETGFSVVVFEDLGGRDQEAERAYLDGVARSGVYIGVLADCYGTMLPSGRSPTHEEYREALRRGKADLLLARPGGFAAGRRHRLRPGSADVPHDRTVRRRGGPGSAVAGATDRDRGG